MSRGLSREEILALAQEVQGFLKNGRIVHFFEPEKRQFVLQTTRGNLLIALQEPFLRFHLLQRLPHLNETPFSKKINAVIHDLKLENIEVLNWDRILQFNLSGKYFLVVEFFSKKPNLYLLDGERTILFTLNPINQTTYFPPENRLAKPIELDVAIDSKKIQDRFEALELEEKRKHEQRELDKFFKRKINLIKKSLSSAEKHLNQCLKWKEVYQKGLLLQSNLYQIKKGMREIVVPNWEKEGAEEKILLDPVKEPFKQVEAIFKESKKLKEGIPHTEKRIEDITRQSNEWASLYNSFNEAVLRNSHEPFLYLLEKKEAGEQEIKRSLPYREYISRSGLKIWVGKSGADNERLTFTFANGSDWWFHVNGFPGSHVILKIEKNRPPDEDSIQDAVQLAIAYSKGKDKGIVEVCMTQRKFVSRMGKHKKGKVQISKHQNLQACLDLNRLKTIKSRSV